MFHSRHARFERDPRIAVVDSIENIPRIGIPFSGIHGVLCPYNPFTEGEIREIATYMQGKIDRREDRSIYATQYFNTLMAKMLPSALPRVFDDLANAFRRATGGAGKKVLRANSTHPTFPHRHDAALSYTFSGTGTICVNQAGEHYAVPTGQILVMDEKIAHMASQDMPEDMPKLTALIL